MEAMASGAFPDARAACRQLESARLKIRSLKQRVTGKTQAHPRVKPKGMLFRPLLHQN
jgi:signal transduction histidine kinase